MAGIKKTGQVWLDKIMLKLFLAGDKGTIEIPFYNSSRNSEQQLEVLHHKAMQWEKMICSMTTNQVMRA